MDDSQRQRYSNKLIEIQIHIPAHNADTHITQVTQRRSN